MGIDLDPLAILQCQVKISLIDPVLVNNVGIQVVETARKALCDRIAIDGALNSRFEPGTREFVDYWFLLETQREIIALDQAIGQVSDEALRRFLYLCLSSVIITKSGGISLARDLAHTRPHRDISKQPRSAFDQFLTRLGRNVTGVRQLAQHLAVKSEVYPVSLIRGSAESISLRSDSVDLVVTSPPYANTAIDYMRAHKFSLVWLGHSIKDLAALRREYIGMDWTTGAEYALLPPASAEAVQSLSEVDSRKGKVLHKYLTEMTRVLGEVFRVLRSNHVAIFVVGSSVMRGVSIETHKYLAEIAVAKGFELVGTVERKLDRNRRMMPARFGGQTNSVIEERMHQEQVVGLYKP